MVLVFTFAFKNWLMTGLWAERSDSKWKGLMSKGVGSQGLVGMKYQSYITAHTH